MATSKEIFFNSYIKKMKRPEFQANRSGSTQEAFNPDNVFGANSVSGSESVNPWAGRDQSNAKFGALGGPSGYKAQIPGFSLSPGSTSGGVGGSEFSLGDVLSHGKAGINLPMIPSSEKSTFNTLMEPVVGAGSKLGSDAIADWLKTDKFSELSPMMGGYVKSVMGDGLDEALGIPITSDSGLGGLDKLLKGAVAESAKDATESAAEGAIPYAGTAMGLLGDTLSGKIIKYPMSSLGRAGGTLAGAALGSMIMPGSGTVLGGALGGGGGRFLGRLFRKIF